MDSIPSKRRKYDLKIISSPKQIHFSGKYSPQNWSLPKSIIDHITDYPSNSEVYQNMIKCCKYFFAKNPILVFSNLYYHLGEWTTERTGKSFDLNNILCKFWITKTFEVFTYMSAINDKTVSSVIPKIYQCDVTDLLLYNQIISADELKILSSKVEYLHFYGVNVMDHDGSVFALEKIFKLFPKIKKFKFDLFAPNAITAVTFKELLKIEQFFTLDFLRLRGVPETFDIESFYIYMKKNQRTDIFLEFNDIFSEDYKIRLEEIVKEIVEEEECDYSRPFIYFNELDVQLKFEMQMLHHEF